MKRIQLIHWKAEEARERIRALRAAGFRVEFESDAPAALRATRENLTDAVVIDLTRLPSHGREMAWALRQNKKTRHLPLVFVGGDPAKVARVRKELPDATFCDWKDCARSVKRAIQQPPSSPVVPKNEQFYSPRSLAAKLGIQAGARVLLIAAPPDFSSALEPLPEGAQVLTRGRGEFAVVLWFVDERRQLERGLERAVKLCEAGAKTWIAYPKKSSGVETDLTQADVRTAPLEHGLVDYKVCAIDDVWSGICFGRRRPG